jgi:hypothetical protein
MPRRRHGLKGCLIRGMTERQLASFVVKQLGELELLPESTQVRNGLVDRANYVTAS